MNNHALVSILMAVYNTDIDYLKEALNSIYNQTYKNIEIVIIDDASDNIQTIEYLHGIKEPRTRIYRNVTNMGLTKSLNIGIGLCKGRYIARMDSDDISESDRIEEQIKYIEEKKCLLVGCYGYTFPPKKRIVPYSCSESGYRVAMIFGNKGPLHSSFLMDRVQLNDAGIRYNENYKTAQDYAFLCECLTKGRKIGICRNAHIGYRIHENQISTAKEREQQRDAERIRLEYIRSTFAVSADDLVIFSTINDNTFRNKCDAKQIEKTLFAFIHNNTARIVSMEIHRYWFRQSLLRLFCNKRYDFIKTRLFFETLRPDRLFYIAANYIKELISN